MAKKKRAAKPRGPIERQILAELKRITARLDTISGQLALGVDVNDGTAQMHLSSIETLLERESRRR